MFYVPVLIFDGTESGSRFHVFRARVPLSYFALPYSFSAVPSASGPVFMFCAPIHIFDGTECVESRFHVLRTRTHFRRYRGRRVPFSCFALQDSFSAVPRASGPFFMFCAPELIFGGTRASCSVFKFCAPGLIFDGTEGVGSRFHVLRSPTHFLRYRRRRVPFSCFLLPDSFSAIPRVSGLVFMFCAPGFVFGGAECIGSQSQFLSARTHF
jgi:hypothetical protein